ncbi:hypothetical protein KUCAC02_004540, partial [Chaenocephalus aceratus]
MRSGRVVDKRNKSEFIIRRAPATTHPSHHDLAKRSKARHADASRSKLKIGDWTRNETRSASRQTDRHTQPGSGRAVEELVLLHTEQ